MPGSSSTTTVRAGCASGLEGELTELYQPAKDYGVNSTEGYVRALIRSENGTDHARLLEVTIDPRWGVVSGGRRAAGL